MKKMLPKIQLRILKPVVFLVLIFSFFLFVFIHTNSSISPTAVAAATAVPSSSGLGVGTVSPPGGDWQPDKEVTFTGKVAARARDVLNWVIANYEWSKVTSAGPNFNTIWLKISTLAYSLLALFILAAAFLLIITKGESLTVRRFIPRFVLVLVLIYLSFPIISGIYQAGDLIQGFFLNKPNNGGIIQAQDLLNVSWDYEKFIGYRRFSSKGEFDESAVISLLLTKLTAATYYAMFIILIMRKVILWFFLVVSPIFPLLLFFSPIRNTAKIWIGEFFRWVLYAPLFAIFLAGLVALWSQGIGIPLNLKIPCSDLSQNSPIRYPTSTNILLGGPCQVLAPDTTVTPLTNVDQLNNLNLTDAFIQYLVALLMLWMVIIVPFILLKIFLDYLNNISLEDNNLMKYILNAQRPKPTPPLIPIKPSQVPPVFPPVPAPPGVGYTGMAREIPRAIERGIAQQSQAIIEALRTSNLKIPNMRDVAKLDSALISGNIAARTQANQLSESLKRIAGTSTLTTPGEKQKFSRIKNSLFSESQKGNALAGSILEATKPASLANIPLSNKVQQVNLEDYEEIKKTWEENYTNLEPPPDDSGKPRNRKDWLKDETKNIADAINMINSADMGQQREGKEMVSKILPFLLLGGFSREEVTAYLKAKLSAAKSRLAVEEKAEGEEFVEIEAQREEKPKTMETEAKLPNEKTDEPGTDINHLGEKAPELYPKTSNEPPTEIIKVSNEKNSSDSS